MSAYKIRGNFYLITIKALLYIIPFLSLYISPSMTFPYITGKNFAFRILVELSAVFWAGLIFLQKEYRPGNSIITTSVLFFTFIVGVVDLFGVNPYNSFWSNYERMEGYITILHLTLYFMILKSVLRSNKDWMIFFRIFLVVSVFISLYALISPAPVMSSRFGLEYFGRVHSTIGNPPFLASYLLLSIFLGLIIILNTKKTYVKYVYLLPIGLNSVVIYLTATRGPILAAMIGIIIFCLYYILQKAQSHREKIIKKVLFLIVVILVITFVFLFAKDNNTFIKQDKTLSRFATMFSDPSVHTRLNAWKMAWNGIKKRPILGWGQENFIAVYTVNPIPFVDTQIWLDRAHNIVMDWLINAGIMGLSSYLAILGSAFYVLYKSFQKKIIFKYEVVTIYILFIVYFVHNLFTFDSINTYLEFFTIMAYIDNIGSVKRTFPPASKVVSNSNKIKSKFILAACLTVLIFFVGAYYINYKPIMVSQFSRRISSSSEKHQSFSSIRKNFDNVLSLRTFGDTDIRRMMVSSSEFIIMREFFQEEGALEFIQSAAGEAEKLVAFHRYNLEYLTEVINFYVNIASYEPSFIVKAQTLIEECILLNPRYEWLYFVLADTYVLQKDYEQAFMIVKKMTNLNPDNDYKQIKLAIAAILTLREDVVNNALENVKRIRTAYDKVAVGEKPIFSFGELVLFAETYKQIRDLHKALYYYKEVLASLKLNNSPDFSGNLAPFTKKEQLHLEAKSRYNMAKIYHELGDRENAINEAQKAASLDPMNYAENVKNLLSPSKK